MNWGTKVVVVYTAFIAGILLMVFKSADQKTDLVTEDYYAKELVYQQKIDEMKRVASLSSPVKLEISGQQLIISFPKDFAGKQITGEALLYCPSDENKDMKNSFVLTDEQLVIPLPPVNTGHHELHLSWSDGSQSFYLERKIFI